MAPMKMKALTCTKKITMNRTNPINNRECVGPDDHAVVNRELQLFNSE